MSWINSRQFTITSRNGRHYVFRRNNAGNTEINIPQTITTKTQAIAWLKAHPNKVANPSRYKAKKGAVQPNGVKLKPFERIINGKKMIAMVNKQGKEYFEPALGPEPGYVVNFLRARGNIIPFKFTCATLKSQVKKMKVIGKGRQGIVFLTSKYSNGRYPFAVKVAPRDLRADRVGEKQPSAVEFNIHKAARDAAPNGVVDVHQLLECQEYVKPYEIDMENVQSSAHYDKSKQSVILMEYCPDGSLKKWLTSTTLTDASLRTMIAQIVTTLYKIKAVYPYFNHNDLHLENIFMSKRGPLIGDFGWARLDKDGTNPAVNKANGTKTASFWGVGPKTDTRYDQHLILNEIRDLLLRQEGATKYPKTLAFLNMAIPEGYRGMKDTHVSEWRLKYEDPCTNLPSLTRLVRNPYIMGRKLVTSPALEAARRRLKKVGVKAKAPSPPKAAKARGYTNSDLVKMTAINFLKLSPATRAKAKVLRAAAKNKKVVPNKKRSLTNRPVAAPSPVKVKVLPVAILKSNKFNKLVTKIWTNQGGASGANFNNAWSKARNTAMNRIQNRINKNMAPFTLSPSKVKAKALSPPKAKAKALSPSKVNYKLSPSSGRAKIMSNKGRWVYANLHYSMDELKSMAARLNVSVKGLRSKANIAKKLFGS